MNPDAIEWLHEVVRLGTRVREMVEPIDFAEYQTTEWPPIGVERYLISMGDAARGVLKVEPPLRERIPGLINAIELRNFLTHAYLHIDDRIVWNVATEKLAHLVETVESVLSDEQE